MKISSKDFRDTCEMADPAKFASTQKPVRPVLKLAYGKKAAFRRTTMFLAELHGEGMQQRVTD